MSIITRWLLALSVLFLLSCSTVDSEGYSTTSSGLQYKIHYLGEGQAPAQPGQQVLSKLSIYNGDSLLWSNALQAAFKTFELKSATIGGLNEALLLLHEGDSASFIVQGPRINLEEVTSGAVPNGVYPTVRVDARVFKVLEPGEEQGTLQSQVDEYAEIARFFTANGQDTADYSHKGMYVVHNQIGDGAKPTYGSEIGVHYQGFFLTGEKFDDTYQYADPVEFSYGKDGQVIDGFSIGLSTMTVGGKAAFVIPSSLAFGSKGSSTGLVPPNTPVIYKVELRYVRN